MDAIITTLVKEYEDYPDDDKFPDYAKKVIMAYQPKTTKRTLVDAERIGTTALYLSKLKSRCMKLLIWAPEMEEAESAVQKQYPEDAAWTEWNDCKTPADFVKLQRRWRKTRGCKLALSKIPVLPVAIRRLGLTKDEKMKRKAIVAARVKSKLNKAKAVDVDALMTKVMPGLKSEVVKQVFVALALATGRRTIEILKTGKLTAISQYKAKFEGQSKSINDEAYDIDLLAPVEQVVAALAFMRDNVDCTGLTNEQVNAKYSKRFGLACYNATGLSPHELRAVNAMACFHLFGTTKAMIAYMKSQLGHASEETTLRYHSYKVTITAPWESTEGKGIMQKDDGKYQLVYYSKPSKHKVEQIQEMMNKGEEISIANVAKHTGGTRSMISRILVYGDNAAIVATHNKKIAK